MIPMLPGAIVWLFAGYRLLLGIASRSESVS